LSYDGKKECKLGNKFLCHRGCLEMKARGIFIEGVGWSHAGKKTENIMGVWYMLAEEECVCVHSQHKGH
jgi:hypothetical protein